MKLKVFFFLLICAIVFLFWPKPTNQVVFVPDETIAKSIAHGVNQRFIYLDDYYSAAPGDLTVFSSAKTKVITGYESFSENKEKLFRSGLLIMRYGMHNKQLSSNDLKVVKKFINNGGRVLLACPAWVYESYEKKKIKDLSFYKVAREFGLILTSQYADGPLEIIDPLFAVDDSMEKMEGVFSGVQIEAGIPVMVGVNGDAAAARAEKGQARLFLWAQNNLFDGQGEGLVVKVLNWLLE